MIDLDTLLAPVLRNAPACPEPLAVSALRDAAREICKRQRLWRMRETMTIAAADLDRCLVQDDQAMVFEFKSVRFQAEGEEPKPLIPIDQGALDLRYPAWRDEPAPGTEHDLNHPRFVTQTRPGSIAIYPRMTGKIYLDLILMPSRTADQIPDFLADGYAEQLAHGASATVLMTPNRDFTNPNLAATFYQLWQGHLDATMTEAITGQQRTPPRTKGNFF